VRLGEFVKCGTKVDEDHGESGEPPQGIQSENAPAGRPVIELVFDRFSHADLGTGISFLGANRHEIVPQAYRS
jgi:hypothetical protein